MSAGGDPFILFLCYKLFKERFYDEFNEFMVCYNNHSDVPIEVVSEVMSRLSKDPKVNIIYHPRGIGNGRPITEMTLISNTDLVMLCEDDFFIFNGKEVSRCFQNIESDLCDMVGSQRMSCGTEISEASKEKYGLDYSGYGDRGPNFWPTGFFCKRSDLMKTDLNFASITFQPGQYSKELNHTFREINHGDTFVWASIQLRAMGLRPLCVPQHKADPYEAEHMAEHMGNWHESQQPFDWIHGGSLSASWGGYLSGKYLDARDDSSLREMETRCAFWMLASDVVDGFDGFKKDYKNGIENLVVTSELDRQKIQVKYNIYKSLLRV